MTPKLQETYGQSGTWQEIVAIQMDLPDSLPSAIHAMWQRNQIIAREHNLTIDPEEFARQFVDRNLV